MYVDVSDTLKRELPLFACVVFGIRYRGCRLRMLIVCKKEIVLVIEKKKRKLENRFSFFRNEADEVVENRF